MKTLQNKLGTNKQETVIAIVGATIAISLIATTIIMSLVNGISQF